MNTPKNTQASKINKPTHPCGAGYVTGIIELPPNAESNQPIAIPYLEHESRNGKLIAHPPIDLTQEQLDAINEHLKLEEEKLAIGRQRYARMAGAMSVWEDDYPAPKGAK